MRESICERQLVYKILHFDCNYFSEFYAWEPEEIEKSGETRILVVGSSLCIPTFKFCTRCMMMRYSRRNRNMQSERPDKRPVSFIFYGTIDSTSSVLWENKYRFVERKSTPHLAFRTCSILYILENVRDSVILSLSENTTKFQFSWQKIYTNIFYHDEHC